MFYLFVLAWMFFSSFAAQVPICKSMRQSGYINDNGLSPVDAIGNFSFDLSVIFNNNNQSFPNTLTVSNFSEWYINPSIINRTSPWSFRFFENPYKKIDCASMSNCTFQFPNGIIEYYYTFTHNNIHSDLYYIWAPEVFVNDGTFFNGENANLWNPTNLQCMYRESAGDGVAVTMNSCCTMFEYINISESANEICQEFESITTITDPSLSTPINLLAHYSVLSNKLDIDIALLNAPDSVYIYYLMLNSEVFIFASGGVSYRNISMSLNLNDENQYEILFDYNPSEYRSWDTVMKYQGVSVGEIIMRNGMLLKNINQTFTSADSCWTKSAIVPFTNATYHSTFCCSSFIAVTEQTTPPPHTQLPTTDLPIDPRSNAIGTLCSNDTFQAWLDIVFIVDASSAMHATQLGGIGGEIATLMQGFTMGQTGNHTTRAAILTYATNVTTVYELTDVTNFNDFLKVALSLPNYANPGDSRASVEKALNVASRLLKNQTSNRITTLVLFAAVYDKNGFDGAGPTSDLIKGDGTTIVVINYDLINGGPLTDALKGIASYGYYYVTDQDNLISTLFYAMAQINCVCPPNFAQMKVNNTLWNNITKYGDCYTSNGFISSPTIANIQCSPGTLLALTSLEKFEFIIDNFVSTNVIKGKKFTIGFHNLTAYSTTWNWWDYDGSEYPLGDYPPWNKNLAPNDDYGYMWNYHGFNWNLTTAHEEALQYVCQQKACDTENICDRSSTTKND